MYERRLHHARLEELAADVDSDGAGRRRRNARECDRALQRRGEGAARDDALPVARSSAWAGVRRDHALTGAQHPATVELESDELAVDAARQHRLERLPADEAARARLERHRPAEARFEGMRTRVHVMAVQIESRLEAQRIARPETAGHDPERIQSLPDVLRLRGGQHHLEAVLARVARAGDIEVTDLRRAVPAERERCGRLAWRQHPRHLCARFRSLHGNQGEVHALDDLGVESPRLRAYPGEIRLPRRAVHDDAEALAVPYAVMRLARGV